jgi:hypothetical protein
MASFPSVPVISVESAAIILLQKSRAIFPPKNQSARSISWMLQLAKMLSENRAYSIKKPDGSSLSQVCERKTAGRLRRPGFTLK